MATLIITRRLHMIVGLQTVELPSKAAVCVLGVQLDYAEYRGRGDGILL